MINYSIERGELLLRVLVVPRSSRSEIVGEHNGALKIKIAAPPVDGAANDELRRVLAKIFKVSKTAIQLVSGESGRAKLVRVTNVTPDAVNLLKNFDS